jgi:signal transduction histidine kinase
MSFLRFHKIRQRLLVVFGALMIGAIALLGYMHYRSVKSALMKEFRQKHFLTVLKASQSSFQSILERAIQSSMIIADDPALLNWFEGKDQNDFARQLGLERLNYIKEKHEYFTVFAVDRQTQQYWRENYEMMDIVSSDDPDDSWFFDAIQKMKKCDLNFDFNKELGKSILFVNVLMGDPNDPVGVAGVGIDPMLLINEFQNYKLTTNSRVWLIDAKGMVKMSENLTEIHHSLGGQLGESTIREIIHTPGNNVLPEQAVREQLIDVAYMNVADTEYKLVMAVPIEELLTSLDVIRWNTLWFSLLMVGVVFVSVVLLARNFSVPISRLTRFAEMFSKGKIKFSIDAQLLGRSDEIGRLSVAFESMKNQLSKVISDVQKANNDLHRDRDLLQQVNEDLSIALDKAAESDRLTRAFLANISHEIRTPMNGVLGFAQLLELEDVDENERRVFAKRVVNGSQQLLAILDNIIHLSKMESGVVQVNRQKVNIQEAIRNTKELFQASAEQKGLTIHCICPETEAGAELTTDPVLLQQVLNNLVSNAIKFTQQGGISISYEVSDKVGVRFIVKDSGGGIPDHQKDMIFEPFRQVNSNLKNTSGAGLGLAICKKIAGLLQGEVGIDSTGPEGSVFYFSV